MVMVAAARLTAPPQDQQDALRGSTAFAFDLARALGSGQGNLVVSPETVSTVLTMLLPGARGRTAAELARVLHAGPLDPTALAAATGDLEAGALADAARGGVGLSQSNAVWAQLGYQLQQGYLRILSGAFRTGVHQADFSHDAERARQSINNTVAQQTGGLIPDLLPPGSVDPLTRLVLTDAVYLKAQWANQFRASDTAPAPFHRAGGGVASVPTMEQVAPLRYAASGGWQAVELPYRGGHLALDLLLPGGWATGAVLAGLDPVRLAAITGALAPATVDVSVPKFTIDSGLNLGQTLQRLGMPTAFGPSADFTGLFNGSREQLALTGVYEQAHIAVDEQGTTAAAAAGAVVGATAGHTSVGVTTVRFDHPFGFALRDVGTGQILFLGQVTDPA